MFLNSALVLRAKVLLVYVIDKTVKNVQFASVGVEAVNLSSFHRSILVRVRWAVKSKIVGDNRPSNMSKAHWFLGPRLYLAVVGLAAGAWLLKHPCP